MFALHRSPRPGHRRVSSRLSVEALEPRCLLATYIVGGDSPFGGIQQALNLTRPGDVVLVHAGTYHEKLTFPSSGVLLAAIPGERPVLRGDGLPGQDIIHIEDQSGIGIVGFEIAGNFAPDDGSGIRIVGSGNGFLLANNHIHDIRGSSAMGITVYGTEHRALSNLFIVGNEVDNVDAAPSEAVTLNGNVSGFLVAGNRVHDVNNIGIDLIGGEEDINPDGAQARNGVVAGNTVFHCHSIYGGGFAAGIYVDGGKNILVNGNVSYQNDLGIEVGAENKDVVASHDTVSNNRIFDNDKGGLVFGGFEASVGRVAHGLFVNNVIYKNDASNGGFGQLVINLGSDNTVTNNILVASGDGVMIVGVHGAKHTRLDNNLWFGDGGPGALVFTFDDRTFVGFDAYRLGAGQDLHSFFADPQFVDAANQDFHLQSGSPAFAVFSPAF